MFDKIKEPKFKIGDVEFSVIKLDAYSGWNMLEEIRHEMSKTEISGSSIADQQQGIQKFLASVLSLDPVFINGIRSKLFAKTEFKTKDVEHGWLKIDSDEMVAMCFANLEASAIYEVLVRSLAVNFTQSFNEIVSHLKSINVNLKP